MFACFQVLNLIRLNFKSSFKSLTFSRFYLQTSTQRKDKAEVQKRRFLHTVSSRQFHCGGGGGSGGKHRYMIPHSSQLTRHGATEERWSESQAWVTPLLRTEKCRAVRLVQHRSRSTGIVPVKQNGLRTNLLSDRCRTVWGVPCLQVVQKVTPPPPPLTFSNPFFLSFIQNTMSLRKGVKESWWGQEDQTAGLETPHHRYFFTCVVFACRLYKCVSYLLLLLKETCGFNGFVMMIKSVSAECPERGQNQINLHFHSIFTKLIIVIHRGQLWREEAL